MRKQLRWLFFKSDFAHWGVSDVEGFEAFHASAPGKRWARFIERMEAGEDDDDL